MSSIEPNTSSPDGLHPLLLALASVALLVGLFVRFWQLSGAPLAVDEYYFGTSVLNTLERGLPQFACGGYYTRGVLLQYLTLPVLQLGASLEFAVRFWPAIASLLTILGVWRIARFAGGVPVAALAVVLACLSVWEIEFARFGRMYAPFQAAFVWYLYFQIQHLSQGRDAAKWWSLGVSAVSIFVYAGASFLLILNFLPLVWRGRKTGALHVALSAVLLVAGVRFYSVDFRYLGISADALPPVSGGEAQLSLPVNVPAVPEIWLPAVLLGTIAGLYLLWRLRKAIFVRHPAILFWALTALCLGFGLFALAAGLVVSGLLLGLPRGTLVESPKDGRKLAGTVLLLLTVWSGVLLSSHLQGGADPLDALRNTLKYLLDFPDVYYLVLRPWLITIPGTALAMILLSAPVALMALRSSLRGLSEDPGAIRYLLGTLVMLVMLAAIFRQPYAITRYTYFLYPVILIIAAAGIVTLTRAFPAQRYRPIVPLAALLALFLITEDYSAAHLANINEPAYRYRTAYDRRLAAHYYPRWDFRSPAEYVNARLESSDRVIVFEDSLPYYLQRTDGAFVREHTEIHQLVWACGGARHLWANAPLLDRDIEVRQMISETEGRVWLITRTERVPWRGSLEQELVRERGLRPRFESQDGHLAVYVIESPASAGR